MGNAESSPEEVKATYKQKSFPGSTIVDSLVAPCGSLKDTIDDSVPANKSGATGINMFLNQAEALCIHSPNSDGGERGFDDFDDEYEDFRRDKDAAKMEEDNSITRQPASPANPTAALFARALVNEVTDNPKTMKPSEMAERERKFLKAQARANEVKKMKGSDEQGKPIGAPGGIGEPTVLGTIAHTAREIKASVLPPSSLSQNRAQVDGSDGEAPFGKYTITIGLSLSRRSNEGHPETVTRQTAYDFNELQDREYKFVSSTDSSGWRAGGGERGGPQTTFQNNDDDNEFGLSVKPLGTGQPGTPTGVGVKIEAPDVTHIPIIHIDAGSQEAIDAIIAALARGEVFIPHMAITPQALSTSGVSPPDLVVRFGTERNEDLPPDEWPNWCLEFMHNQLYEYFQGMGARWMKRPFQITLAKKVRWKTVKHMNRYFANAERVVDAWREKGPQYLDPQLEYTEGGAAPEEVSRPHGIYLLRNGVATNYFAPNFEPPYTTKMTRSLLMNVLGKSWDKKKREWTSEPIPKLITPNMLVTAMCGCGDANDGGFMANEITIKTEGGTSAIPKEGVIRSKSPTPKASRPPHPQPVQQQQPLPPPEPQAPIEAKDADADTDIVSEPVTHATPSHHTSTDRTMRSQTVHTILSEEESEPTPAANSTATTQSYTQLNLKTSNSEGDNSNLETPISDTIRSPKYGAPPTPEEMISTRSSTTSNNDRFEKNAPIDTNDAQEDQGDMPASSEVGNQPSVTGTNSTIMHMNLSAQTFMKRHLARNLTQDEKKEDPSTLASDEDWLDDLGKPLPSPAIVAKNQDPEEDEKPLTKDRFILSDNKNAAGKLAQRAARAKRSPKDAPDIRKNNSGVSLDYSVDSTHMGDQSTFMGDQSTIGGGSSLLGGKFATDASVATAVTKEPLASTSTPEAKKDPIAANEPKLSSKSRSRDDDEASSFSLQESSSSIEVIPSDEELFAVGWAKALDPKSGSYYYFTLDRTKIVWDNPLAPVGESGDSTESTSLPEGSAAI